MARYRDVSPLEFSYLASDSKTRSWFVNQFVVEGKGNITLADLQHAVHKAAHANPGIHLKLAGRWSRRYWSDEGAFPIVYEAHQEWDACSEHNAFFQNSPINCRKDAVAEVILFKNKIVFRTHHAICDGGGMMHWIQEVFRALRGENLAGSDGRLYDWALVKGYSFGKSRIPNHSWSPILPIQDNTALFQSHWLRFPLECKTPRLLARLIYLLARIPLEREPEAHLCFRIPSDLRRLLEDSEIHLGNLTGTIDLEITAIDTVESIYNKIINAKRKNDDLCAFNQNLGLVKWLPKSFFTPGSRYFKKRYQQGYCNISGIVSCFSHIKLDDFSCQTFQAHSVFAIPIPLEGVSVSCTLFQNNQNIQACLSIPKAFADSQQLEALATKLKQGLESEHTTAQLKRA